MVFHASQIMTSKFVIANSQITPYYYNLTMYKQIHKYFSKETTADGKFHKQYFSLTAVAAVITEGNCRYQ